MLAGLADRPEEKAAPKWDENTRVITKPTGEAVRQAIEDPGSKVIDLDAFRRDKRERALRR